MVPWLRPRRMRDMSLVMVAEAMMRAIPAISPKTSISFNPSVNFRARHSASGAAQPSHSATGSSTGKSGRLRRRSVPSSEIAEIAEVDVELCTTDDPSRVSLVFPAADAGGHAPAVQRVQSYPPRPPGPLNNIIRSTPCYNKRHSCPSQYCTPPRHRISRSMYLNSGNSELIMCSRRSTSMESVARRKAE